MIYQTVQQRARQWPAVDYSVQYMPQRALPDKAIDLIDMTAAHLAAKHPARDAKAIEKDIEAEEKRLKGSLELINYDIDDLGTLEAVIGTGRVEKVSDPGR